MCGNRSSNAYPIRCILSGISYLLLIYHCAWISYFLMLFHLFNQYLKHIHTRRVPLLERFALLAATAIIWLYAHLLTVGGAYKHSPPLTQSHCRTDRANLISAAPWLAIIQSIIVGFFYHQAKVCAIHHFQDKDSVSTAVGRANI